ncbi:MAG: hypothetical protein AAGC44_11105 [Planctomycetota bacterium]
MAKSPDQGPPFYVGYLPLPPAIRRFILPWVAGNLVLVMAVAVAIASQQRDPGDGVWDTGQAVTIHGLVVIDPYPRLVVLDQQGKNTTTVLPVEQGKIGSQERLAPFTGQTVALTGYRIERNGFRVLEIDSTAEVKLVEPPTAIEVLQQPIDLGRHELVGEIVDPKCYFGVMKPGDGKPHKICATLCITGGIPPVFIVRDAAGQTTAYLLTGPSGEAMPEQYYGYIADPIRLTGRVLRREGQLVLRADWSSLIRLE